MKSEGLSKLKYGDLLAELRIERGLRQADTARVLGITTATISSYERQNSAPDLYTLKKLCDFYDVSADYLLGRTKKRRHISLEKQDVSGFSLTEILDVLYRINMFELSEAQQVAYIVRTIKNMAYNLNKYNQRFVYDEAKTVMHALESEESEKTDPYFIYEQNYNIECFNRIFKSIPERYQEILFYKYIEHMDDKAIGKELNIKAESVRALLTRARRKLKKYLQANDYEKEKESLG